MSLSLYQSAELAAVQQLQDTGTFLQNFWLQFFPRKQNFLTQTILFDQIDYRERRLAMFVPADVQGPVFRRKGFDTRSIAPAYIKDKDVIQPSETLGRLAGEPLDAPYSQQQRWDILHADLLLKQKTRIQNTWDWMCCQALVEGRVTIASDLYPSVTVDFNRNAALTGALAGGAQWSEATASPLTDLADMSDEAFDLSNAPITDYIFGKSAWRAFVQLNHDDVQRALDGRFRGSESSFNQAGLSGSEPYEFQGTLQGVAGSGVKRLWTFSNRWEEYHEDGTSTFFDYFDPGAVIGLGGQAKNSIITLGAIQDKKAGFIPADMWPKEWDVEDPSATYLMTQSAPLPVPNVPNNTFKLTVVGS